MVVGVGAVESGLGIAGDGALGCHVGEDHFDHLALASVAMSTGLRGSRETSEYRRNGSGDKNKTIVIVTIIANLDSAT